ncbi:MAG: ATP-dependent DNA helicase RecG [Rhodospirillales bacterium]|nr:ATP-dependent DNA helicase RecG [Rhodospirillales bacterium]MCB9996061.1 ATP-dependent DNA helicase RecG [Rhodospirillales bacterium]
MQASAEKTAPQTTGRPFILDPVFRRVTDLPGVGPRNAKLFEKICSGDKVLDVLWHKPIEIVDRRFTSDVAQAPAGRIATLTVTIDEHKAPPRRNLPYRVKCHDATGHMDLVFFHAHKDWLAKQLPIGSTVIVSGKIDYYQGNPQMAHPDAIGSEEDRSAIETVEPVYPLTQGLTNKVVRKAVQGALDLVPTLPEWQNDAFKKQNSWPDWDAAVRTLHNPPGANGLELTHPARMRLAYDELLAGQLALAMVRHHQKRKQGRAYQTGGALRETLLGALPFALTRAQQRAIGEIDKDMQEPIRMLRLLQGDVGAGKTVVAALAMLNAIASGCQAAIMAPTEILARQHAESLKPWLEACGIRFVILTGRDKGKARETLLSQIRNGAAQIVIGTHALFQEGVEFADLGVAVIDEQHRFGVHQRLMLAAKGSKEKGGVDVLVMTATPIPRTLTLTAYGDMDVSKLDEKPPGRKPVDTRLIAKDHLGQMIDGIARQIQTGARAYWVCPLVEESEVLDLAAAEERYEVLEARFGERVGLVHGKMKPADKDAVMEKFAAGDIDILVATTVIEVGVNVPEATIMVIEHAERFGLSQLHQLRGRVGRGADKSYCFLMYGNLTKTAKERLSIMRDTEDGFKIAEKDLELRGAGEILGTRQSGMPVFRLAELPAHADLLAAARDDARLIMDKDPDLKGPRGDSLRILLYLFERDQAIQYLRSG